MKIIESRAHSLQREINSLKQELDDVKTTLAFVQQERDKFESLYRNNWKKYSSLGRDNAATATTSIQSRNSTEGAKSYMRSTIASNRRVVSSHKNDGKVANVTVQNDTSTIIKGKRYVDGQLLPVKPVRQPYMFNTHATAAKNGDWHHTELAAGGWPEDVITTDTSSVGNDSWGEPSNASTKVDAATSDDSATTTPCTSPTCEKTCLKCAWLDASNASNTSDDSLHMRSRLYDTTFYSAAPSQCFIPFKHQIRYLSSALKIAQEVLWTALRGHWPHFQQRLYRESPREVRFGTEELREAGFGTDRYPAIYNSMCGQPSSVVRGAITSVTILRNAVCHPSGWTSVEIDALVKRAQNLAVVLQDERRAFKLRAIRDDLQCKVIQAFTEIKDSVGFATLPGTRPWAVHHQRLFQCVKDEIGYERYNALRFDPVILLAARDWIGKGVAPGKGDPENLANIRAALKNIGLLRSDR